MIKFGLSVLLFGLTALMKGECTALPDKAYKDLTEGNKRFATGKLAHPNLEEEAREKQTGPQSPYAVIIGCSDSRVPPEIVFDQGVGDFFVIRNAGNIVSDIVLDSVEYAINVLDVPLILVLGHQDCGAVKAVISGAKQAGSLDAIFPIIASATSNCTGKMKDKLTQAIYCNVRKAMEMLKTSRLGPDLKKKNVRIVGGYYDFETRKVSFINP